ncbi:MAG: hypothetical protein KC438_06580 [Thermomicrobiales bacterium]|nr:hypothetical protein [Thermomicrobiales bacterium]
MSDLIRPAFIHDFGIEITQGEDFCLAFLACAWDDQGNPVWSDTSAYTAELAIRSGDTDGTLVLDASAYVQLGYTPPLVERSTAYSLGQRVTVGGVGGISDGYLYECTTAGTTDGSPVIFTDTLGATTNDGTAVWTCVLPAQDGAGNIHIANVVVNIPHAVTGGLDEWGRGSWSLSVKNGFSNSWFYVDGPAVLRKSSL